MNSRLDSILREARIHYGRRELEDLDWGASERALLARIDRESAARVPNARSLWSVRREAFTASLALAAVVAVLLEKSPSISGVDRAVHEARIAAQGGVTDLDGEVLVDGATAGRGTAVRVGNVIDSQAGSVLVSRPGKVDFVVERGSRARIVRWAETVVVALDYGAVEANVEHVYSSEAFAVDVGSTRVAAHGTHLRVSRLGDDVVVDLTDGIVSVGPAPREGDVAGILVSAPAHAEFVASSLSGTFSMTHATSAVRPAIPISPGSLNRGVVDAPPAASATSQPDIVDAPLAVPSASTPRPSSAASATIVPTLPARSAVPSEPVTATSALASAIRECLKQQPHPENVRVAFSSTLYLRVGGDGSVRSARFDPPVAPDVNACAAPQIYSAHFDTGGAITIPIDFKN